MDTLVSRPLYLWTSSQNPVFLNSHLILYFYIPVSHQLQLQTPFSRHEGVHSQDLPLYLYEQGCYYGGCMTFCIF